MKNVLAYVCTNRKCKRKILISLKNFESIKVEIRFVLRAIYCFVLGYDNAQFVSTCEITEPKLIKIKKNNNEFCNKKKFND
jgi:hypothetical protein